MGLTLAVATGAQAGGDEATQTLPLVPMPERLGYAFGQPRILIVQRLFGLSHGIALLAAACRDLPDETLAQTARIAYGQWRSQQIGTVLAMQDELARWYFGREAARADRSDVVRALGLMPRLEQPGQTPGEHASGRTDNELRAACQSLPEVLHQPRYDLQRRLRLEEVLSQVALGIRAEETLTSCLERLTEREQALLRQRYAAWQASNGGRFHELRQLAGKLWPEDQDQSFAQWQATRRQQEARHSRQDCLRASQSLASAALQLNAVGSLPLPVPASAPTEASDAATPAAPAADGPVPAAQPATMTTPSTDDAQAAP